MPPNLVNFGRETAENDWRVCPPLNFCICIALPALPHGRHITDTGQVLALVM